MATTCDIARLEPIVAFLEGLSRRADVEQLRERLTDLDIGPEDVAAYARFDPRRYVRNLIFSGPFYHLLVLCWRSGQRSPIHNHAGSTCGVRVLRGIATETLFEPTPCGQIKAVRSADLTAGQVCATQDANIHQVSNLQASGEDLMTLHIYTPPLLRMDTFSLTDTRVSEFRPVFLEHGHGSGI